MIFKYKNSNNITGKFEINEDGELTDYELYVPDNVPLLPVEIAISNLHTIYLKMHGINRMKPENKVEHVMIESSKSKTKYELVKCLINQNE